MNDQKLEAACWRIWYRLNRRGECTQENLMANCGLHSDLIKAALQTLIDIGQIEYSVRSDGTWYELADEKARIMQVFPTMEVPENA